MNLKFLSRIAGYTLGGCSMLYVLKNDKFVVFNSWNHESEPSKQKFDYNWDFRGSNSTDNPIEKKKPTAVRHIILIRHGQYNLKGLQDKDRILTELGRQQAKLTGERLNDLQIPFSDVYISTMARAQETGRIILQELKNRENLNIINDSLIEEGSPIPPEPQVGHWRAQVSFFQDGARIEAGFREHFHRADPSQKTDSYTLLVCHANVIRYFVCRALQVRDHIFTVIYKWFLIKFFPVASRELAPDFVEKLVNHLDFNTAIGESYLAITRR
jgi:serine/threonine-protein phosphatase PGAM5